jgi:hypothetical protein
MKEIDFLPEWYKSGRRRRFNYRTQYIALGGILLVMAVWNLLGLHSISKAKAQIEQNAPGLMQAENVSAKLADLQNKISRISQKQAVIYNTDSRINIANILAEMSGLISDKIVLSKVEIIAEKFDEQQSGNSSAGGTAVRSAVSTSNKNQETISGDVRFKIVITGVASNAIEVADLIRNLEDSQYFSGVVLSYSRNTAMQIQDNTSTALKSTSDLPDISKDKRQKEKNETADIQVSKFEISCHLANYRQVSK